MHYLAGDYESALAAIDLNRGLGQVDQEALLVDCVRRDPRLWRTAALRHPRNALRVLRVRFSRS